MPLTARQAAELTIDEALAYLPQLGEISLDYFSRSYVAQATANPSSYRDRGRILVLKDIISQHRESLTLIPRPSLDDQFVEWEQTFIYGDPVHHDGMTPRPGSRERTFYDRVFPPEERARRERELLRVEEGRRVEAERLRSLTHVVTTQGDYTTPIQDLLPLQNLWGSRQRSWELSFLEEVERVGDEKLDYEGITPEEQPVTVVGLSMKETAELLPAGALGLHFLGSNPNALLFRSKREDDPSKRALKNQGWFDVKGETAVMWAAPTLEAYNTLLETDLEFTSSLKARKWLQAASLTIGDLVAFGGNCPLFLYQKEAVLFLKERKRALLALSPGLGKTLTSAFASSLTTNTKVLLVCPASLLHYWSAELAKWTDYLPMKPMTEIWHKETGTVPSVIPPGCQFWAITNPETLVRYPDEFAQDFQQMIVDESIMYKHRDSKRSIEIGNIARSIDWVWLLTGAPATRYLDDMWHQFHILNQRGYASYWRFANRYCVVEETPWAKNVIANKRGAEDEIKKNFADIYFARSQDQVLDIPDWLMEDVDIPMQPKQEAVYEKLQKELWIEIEGRDDTEILDVTDRLSLMTRSLQVASNPVLLGSVNSSGKWSVLPELMEVYPGPYIVWVNFVRTGEMLKESLKELRKPNKHGGSSSMRVCLANGSTPMIDRNQLVEDFQADKYDIIILNDMVGKFGFNLTRARTSFFVERNYNDSYFQCLYRNRRIGTTQSPVVVNMRAVTQSGNRTIDHVVHDALDYRNGMIKRITVGDLRGIIYE